MALRFLDSFDHYTTVIQKWTSFNGGGIGAPSARTGVNGLSIAGAGTEIGPVITLGPQGTWIVGFAYRSGAFVAQQIARTKDLATTQGSLYQRADGTLELRRGDGASVAVSTRSLITNTYYYIEFKHIVAAAGGSLEVRVNGEVWVTFVGNTQNTANPTANVIHIGHINNYAFEIDDVYIFDGTGAVNNDYAGDTRIEAILPNGVGFYTELATLVGAASHWQAVNEVPPNEDASYVADNIVNARDTFTFQDLVVASALIPGIQILIRWREDTAGGAHIARMYRSGGVDNQGADIVGNTGYIWWNREIVETDPIAAAPWTVANINAAEFGVRIR